MIPFAAILRRDRRHQRMSQTELAERLGVHQQEVSLWEIGRRTISEENKSKLVEVLGPQSELALNFDQIDFSYAVDFSHSIKPRRSTKKGREWVGLTFADIDSFDVSLDWIAGARWAEAKLKEKNC